MRRPDIEGIRQDIAAGKIPKEPTETLLEYIRYVEENAKAAAVPPGYIQDVWGTR